MASSQPVLLSRNAYDPLDRLISQFLPGAAAHQRFYCKSRLSTEIQGAIGYSFFQKEDLLLAQQKRQHDAVEGTLLATDLQRSVLLALKADQLQPIAYSPYGHRRAGLSNLLGFNGERPDPATGNYLLGNGYRAFNPVLMRFNCPDSLSPFGKGGLNSYAYCFGDPINLADPNGHNPIPKIISSTLIFRKSHLTSKPTIAFTEGSVTTLKKTSLKTFYPLESFIEEITLFTEQGVKKTQFSKYGDELTLIHPDQPTVSYPAKFTLRDLAYNNLRPADLDSDIRLFASKLTPAKTDSRNRYNFSSVVEFNLNKAGVPRAEIAQRSRHITDYHLMMGEIRGAFPEKLNRGLVPSRNT